MISLIENYITNRKNLFKIFVLIDCKIGIKNFDIDIIDKICFAEKKFSIILTKIDKCAISFVEKQRVSIGSLIKNYGENFEEIFTSSSKKNKGILNIQKNIFNLSKKQ